MRKKAKFFLLLLAFGLCSCSNTPQVVISTEEPTTAVTAPEDINLENPTNIVSIVFAGETIMAPGYYPNVPDEYIPVLDDLYLCGKLSHQYSILNYEGKITKDILHEYENVLSEIRRRGYLPYPGDGLGIHGGYALIDLDADGNLELLILNNSPYSNQNPVIKSIFAIRNGQLVCIDNGSFELNYTILSADNTFYKCIDWRAAGYADLIAFRLKAGMQEFTIISEAHAALSFTDGDVPVPYWIMIENGNEISITEDDFHMLLAQYKSPSEKMTLDCVPLHPNAVDPWSIPRPANEPSINPIEYPEAYQGAPEAYKTILDALFLLENNMRQEEYSEGEDLYILGFVEYPYLRDNKLGYACVDLNNDGILELLLGTTDELSQSAPNSIFTLKDGQPVLLESFWSRSRGVISADGIIYGDGSDGAAYTILSSYRFEKNADALTQLTDIRSDYSEFDYYYQVIEGRNHYISKQEFDYFLEIYANPPERMKLTVIPIVH